MNPAYVLSQIRNFKKAMEELLESTDEEEEMDEGSFYS